MEDITDQAGHPAMQAFWDSPLGKKWREESRKAWEELDHKENIEIVFLDMKNCKIVRLEE